MTRITFARDAGQHGFLTVDFINSVAFLSIAVRCLASVSLHCSNTLKTRLDSA